MTSLSIGDLSQHFLQRLQNTQLKEDLNTLTQELSTGYAADMSAHLGGDYSGVTSIDRTLELLGAYDGVITETELKAGATQSALGLVQDRASAVAQALIVGGGSGQADTYDTISADAGQALADVLAVLNTRVSDRSIFAGTQTDSASIVTADTLMAEIVSLTAAATTAEDTLTIVSDWFADPAGFAAFAYQGGDDLPQVRISPTSQTRGGVTAIDPGITGLIEGLVVASLSEAGVMADTAENQQVIAEAARASLIHADTGMTALRADVGRIEQDLEQARSRNSSERSGLQLARNGLLAIDPYDTATALEAVQSQLEMLYTITGRMQRLTLADYI